jgi:formate dehydrogenase gamma subunit
MSAVKKNKTPSSAPVRTVRTFKRFNLAQRWEHALLFLSITVLILTGLPQKYRTTGWSQTILATPERVELVQTIHHIAAIVLGLVVIYHLGVILVQLSGRRLPGDMLPTWQDFKDAWHMIQYLVYVKKDKPKFGKYNFEQKVSYWFVFVAIGILGVSGLINWFPEFFTRFLPGEIVPAAKLAHSTEAISLTIFIIIWHFYHVHLERLNLSIFTGTLNEEEMAKYHQLEYKRLIGKPSQKPEAGDKQE